MLEKNDKICYNTLKNCNQRGIIAMHKIISAYINEFCDDSFISETEKESKKFEYFINYCLSCSKYCDDVNVLEVTTQEDDAGLDGILIFIDGQLITTVDEAKKCFESHKRNLEVQVLFVQSKTSDSYDRGEILKFGDGVVDFVSETPSLPQGEFVRNYKKIFDCIINNVSKIQNGRPDAFLKYVCTSNNEIQREIIATRDNIIRNVVNTGYFNDVQMEYYGLSDVMKLWESTKRNSVATINTIQTASYPIMKGIEEAYIAVVRVKDYISCVLQGEDGKQKTYLYEENVRAFLGEDNPVNDSIKNTLLDKNKCDKFAIYNNGITIISPDVKVQSNRISFENYQIVNGCQTSNILFSCKDSIDENTMITIKIIEATDPDIIADIVRATNSQSKVDENQFLSFSPFVRRLEKFFDATEDIEGKEVKLFFERRNGQYKNSGVQKKKVFGIGEVGRALGSIFLLVPDLASRYPNKFVKEKANQLFDEKNKEEAFYAAALVDYRFKQLSTRGKLLNKYAIYKWHILTIFGFLSTGTTPPSIQNKSKVTAYANKLLKVCCNEDECLKTFEQTIKIVEEIGLKKDRDEVRSTAYANAVKKYCHEKLVN
jgi:hypothetical protein